MFHSNPFKRFSGRIFPFDLTAIGRLIKKRFAGENAPITDFFWNYFFKNLYVIGQMAFPCVALGLLKFAVPPAVFDEFPFFFFIESRWKERERDPQREPVAYDVDLWPDSFIFPALSLGATAPISRLRVKIAGQLSRRTRHSKGILF